MLLLHLQLCSVVALHCNSSTLLPFTTALLPFTAGPLLLCSVVALHCNSSALPPSTAAPLLLCSTPMQLLHACCCCHLQLSCTHRCCHHLQPSCARCCCHHLQLSFARCCCHHLQSSFAHCCTTCSFLAVFPQLQRHCILTAAPPAALFSSQISAARSCRDLG